MSVDIDGTLWKLEASRLEHLGTIDNAVSRHGCGQVLFYPGCGNDVPNALFACASRVTHMVFVDTNPNCLGNMAERIHTKSAMVDKVELVLMAEKLKIVSGLDQACGWQFDFRGTVRYVLFFKCGSSEFLRRNRGFCCDVFFEKDFWETSATNPLTDWLPCINLNGFYMSNSANRNLIPLLNLYGMVDRCPAGVDVNGYMSVWQKTSVSTTIDIAERAMEAGKTAAFQHLFGDIDVGMLDREANVTDQEWEQVFACTILAVAAELGRLLGMSAASLLPVAAFVTFNFVSNALMGVEKARPIIAAAKVRAEAGPLDMAIMQSLHGRTQDFKCQYFGENATRILPRVKMHDRSVHTELQGLVGAFLRPTSPMRVVLRGAVQHQAEAFVRLIDGAGSPDLLDWEQAIDLLSDLQRQIS